MKLSVSKFLCSLAVLGSLLGGAAAANAQVTVYVDPNQSFIGYMNVFDLSMNYVTGFSYGPADLKANYVGTNLVLQPCSNVYETTDTFWFQADGVTPNKIVDASFYVDNDALANTNLTFVGYCVSNTLVPEPHTGIAYTSTAFIKSFDQNYNLLASTSANLVTGTPFSITLNTTGGTHIQYGTETIGPDANPTEQPTLGQVLVAQYQPATPIAVPTNNAPTPTRPASSVLSLYNSSGVYTNHPVETFLANFSSANEAPYTNTVTGRVVLRYSALQYAGVTFYDTSSGDNMGGTVNYSVNATPYTTFHVDVWTPNANQFGFQLVSLNPTESAEVDFLPASGTITSNNWIPLDVPLSTFTNINPSLILSDLQQLLWIDNETGGGVTGGIFYLDNVYFYNSNSVSAPTPTFTAKVVSGSIQISIPTVSGFTYTVQYKTNLTDATWVTLTSVTGNGSTQVVTDSATTAHRFYRVYAH